MSTISAFDAQQMQANCAKGRNPKKAAAEVAQKAERFANGQEKQLSALLCADLRRRGIPYICARTDRKSTIQDGWPDITAMWGPNYFGKQCSRVCCVELKVEGGRLSAAQEACHAHLRAAGVPLIVAYDLQTAIAFIRKELGV